MLQPRDPHGLDIPGATINGNPATFHVRPHFNDHTKILMEAPGRFSLLDSRGAKELAQALTTLIHELKHQENQ